MAEIQDLNVTDASNVARWPENMQFSAVNDAGRADEGLLARWYKDMDASVVASGSSNAFTATSNRTISSLVNNTMIMFEANHTISGTATFNLNGLGAKTIKRFSGDTLTSGDITSGQPVWVVYKSSPDCWYMLNAASALDTSVTTIAFTETASPGSASADTSLLYARDEATQTTMYWKDSAATEHALTNASVNEMTGGVSTSRTVMPGRQHYHPGHPKCWAKVTVSAGSPTLSTSYNISSVSDSGQGLLTLAIATDFSTANWCCLLNIEGTNVDTYGFSVSPGGQTASNVLVKNEDASDTSDEDPTAWHLAGLGNQA